MTSTSVITLASSWTCRPTSLTVITVISHYLSKDHYSAFVVLECNCWLGIDDWVELDQWGALCRPYSIVALVEHIPVLCHEGVLSSSICKSDLTSIVALVNTFQSSVMSWRCHVLLNLQIQPNQEGQVDCQAAKGQGLFCHPRWPKFQPCMV